MSATVHIAVIFVLLLLEQRRPAATLAWLLAVIFLPYIGLGLFMLVGTRRMVRRTRKRGAGTKRLHSVFERYRIAEKMDSSRDPAIDDERTEMIAKLSAKLSQLPTTYGNATELLINATATYRSLYAGIR
ncbi:MAG: PLDc N-terminal domain-containing protein, partial [Myxococcales bacterium]|nr:PLDc N-terminal domain-containing protein [Myxococcales bacterium]